MSQPPRAISVLAAALVLCAVSIPSQAASARDDGALRSGAAQAYTGGGIILIAAARERAGGGQRPVSAREAPGKRAGATTVNRQAAETTNRQVRSSATSNVNHNRATTANVNGSVNRDVNANRNVSIDRDVDVNVRRDYYDGWDDHWHPVAAAAAVTATAIAVGSLVRTLPPSCSTVVVNGVSYSQCGGTWYLPQYSGTTVQYVVVNAPR